MRTMVATTNETHCEGCGKRPEVYGSSWCAHCHDTLPEYTKERILTMRNALITLSVESCERVTTGPGSCWSHANWSPDAKYSDDRWCDGCIALAALLHRKQSEQV
jgi:hypothetical protein